MTRCENPAAGNDFARKPVAALPALSQRCIPLEGDAEVAVRWAFDTGTMYNSGGVCVDLEEQTPRYSNSDSMNTMKIAEASLSVRLAVIWSAMGLRLLFASLEILTVRFAAIFKGE